MKKWIGIGLVVITAVLLAGYLYVNQPHRSVSSEEGMSISADSLFLAFQQDEMAANNRFLNAVLRVRGKIKSVEHNTEGKQVVVLETGDMMFGINCALEEAYPVKEGDEVVVKGICTGYLADVVINQAVIEKNP
ncbi:MAG: hypothetical protein JNL40_09355 [Cyclobacteriaceae bacterium]|nr:hypothetical protein [Cyclobacteriaceae bacterium]